MSVGNVIMFCLIKKKLMKMKRSTITVFRVTDVAYSTVFGVNIQLSRKLKIYQMNGFEKVV